MSRTVLFMSVNPERNMSRIVVVHVCESEPVIEKGVGGLSSLPVGVEFLGYHWNRHFQRPP